MIHVITSANRHLYEPELLTHFRLRHEVYVVERNWKELDHADGLERDQFDNQDATYIMAIDNGEIVGGSRLIPTTNPHLLSEVFPYLALGSRFAEGGRYLRMDANVRDQESARGPNDGRADPRHGDLRSA